MFQIFVKSLSNLKNMNNLLTDSPTWIQENTIRDGGSTALYTVFTAYSIQIALQCLKIACMPMYIVREGFSTIEMD